MNEVITLDKEGQIWAMEARLTALIKTKNFEQALDLIKGN
jgi:hypothetical protein